MFENRAFSLKFDIKKVSEGRGPLSNNGGCLDLIDPTLYLFILHSVLTRYKNYVHHNITFHHCFNLQMVCINKCASKAWFRPLTLSLQLVVGLLFSSLVATRFLTLTHILLTNLPTHHFHYKNLNQFIII